LNATKLIDKNTYFFFFSSTLLFILLNIIGIWKELPYFNAIPFLILFAILLVKDYRLVFYFLMASLPISIDFFFGSLSLSAPSEPILMLSTGLWIILFINKRTNISKHLSNPILILLLLQLVLFTLNIFVSLDPVLSFKYLLAKIWFFGGFIFLPLIFLKDEKNYKIAFWSFFIPLMLTVFYTIFNHALTGFSFEKVNESARPFYVNHVIYACTLGLSLPFCVAALGWYKNNPFIRMVLFVCILVLIFAIITSYTRTTWLSVLAAIASIVVFNSKFLKLSFAIALIGIVVFCYQLVDQNNYMKYAPNYTNTVFNREDFGKHMEATVELSDVSGMERVYRWVAAINLIQHNFWFGTGNNTFYPTYKEYANPAFITYLSDNPERSSTHNYFLLIFCDQGVFGFLLFIVLYIWAMLKTKTIYLLTKDRFVKTLMTTCFATLVIFLVHLVLGDMVEVDKNGGIFLFILGIIMAMDLKVKSSLETNKAD
jgi:O-antigen ligase